MLHRSPAVLVPAVAVLCLSLLGARATSAQNGTWVQLSSAGAPSARAGHAFCFDSKGKRMIVMGGEEQDGELDNKVWALSLGTCTPHWDSVATTGGPPSARKEHTMVYDPASNRVILFGGEAE